MENEHLPQDQEQQKTPEQEERERFGREGRLYTIEVTYNYFNRTRRVIRQNCYWVEVLKFREEVFKKGLLVPVKGKDHMKVISPFDITDIDLMRQAGYWVPNKWEDKEISE